MKCPRCGTENVPDANFCSHCHFNLKQYHINSKDTNTTQNNYNNDKREDRIRAEHSQPSKADVEGLLKYMGQMARQSHPIQNFNKYPWFTSKASLMNFAAIIMAIIIIELGMVIHYLSIIASNFH